MVFIVELHLHNARDQKSTSQIEAAFSSGTKAREYIRAEMAKLTASFGFSQEGRSLLMSPNGSTWQYQVTELEVTA
jgi:hypothetical protein